MSTEMTMRSDLFTETQTRLMPRPIRREFYREIARKSAEWRAIESDRLDELSGRSIRLEAGQLLRLKLLEGAQIVNVFAFNADDPDERYWAQNTQLTESLFLTRYSRMWGSMARNRPLLTIVEDTVTSPRRDGAVFGRHHPAFGGWGTPGVWRSGGGRDGVRTTWEQLGELMDAEGLPRSLIKEDVCFFQKVAIEPYTSHVYTLPSDALRGDRVTLFAEIDVRVLLAVSPYIDGARPPSELDGARPRPVEATRFEAVAAPLGWPYPGEPYPDLALYLGADGTRSGEPGPTPIFS